MLTIDTYFSFQISHFLWQSFYFSSTCKWYKFKIQLQTHWRKQWNSWLRHCYQPEGRGLGSRLCHWDFSLFSFWSQYGPGVDSASDREEYQAYLLGGKDGQCVGLIALPPSCAHYVEIWEPQPPGKLSACERYSQGLRYIYTCIYLITRNSSDTSNLYRQLIKHSKHLCPFSTYLSSLAAKQRS